MCSSSASTSPPKYNSGKTVSRHQSLLPGVSPLIGCCFTSVLARWPTWAEFMMNEWQTWAVFLPSKVVWRRSSSTRISARKC